MKIAHSATLIKICSWNIMKVQTEPAISIVNHSKDRALSDFFSQKTFVYMCAI